MAKVELKNVGKRYNDKYAVSGVNVTIEDGEFVVLVGPTGCGKTTTLRMIAGLEEISEGDLLIDGVRANDLAPGKRGIAMVFQSYALYPHMTAAENMSFGLKLQGKPKAEIDEAVKNAAEVLGISQMLDRKPGKLSGGQRQRVAIGRAITRHPKVFLFDEPLSNLDAALRIKMRVEFARLHKVLDATMIYVTHDQIEAMTLANRIVVFSAGHVEQIGTPLTLYQQPANLFVAGFIGAPTMNFLDATIVQPDREMTEVRLKDGSNFRTAADSSSIRPGAKVKLGIRPESFATEGERGPNAQPFPVTIAEHEFTGDMMLLYADSPQSEEQIVARLNHPIQVQDSERVDLFVEASDTYLFAEDGQALRRTQLPEIAAPRQHSTRTSADPTPASTSR